MHELRFNVPSRDKNEVYQALLFLLKSRYGKDYENKYNLMHNRSTAIIDSTRELLNKYYLPKLLSYNCDIRYAYYDDQNNSLNINFYYKMKEIWKLNEKTQINIFDDILDSKFKMNYFADIKFSSCIIMDTIAHINQETESLSIDLVVPSMNNGETIIADCSLNELYHTCKINEELTLSIEATPSFVNENHSFLVTPIAKLIKNNDIVTFITNSYIRSKLIFQIQLMFNKGMSINNLDDDFIKGIE